jgi:dTDP-3-amino-2,3,6-trideoxy-4-keto-D-glucose/dTDP-3-amino-3,4,6-trideoxy-alpha-D-glucose/dTDP-2,6-dideoxy-D-kanosamine transaminase
MREHRLKHIPYSYLDRQFADVEPYFEDIRQVVESGDFTLGAPVREFEERFADLCGLPFAIGVGSGTDALLLSLKSLGIGPGDEVITTPNTFIATVGAIATAGARPVFVDCNEEYTIAVEQIEAAIGPRTKAILPVHLTGNPADMPAIVEIARRHGLLIVEDAAQAILASIDGKHVGSEGTTGCFSLHPLKNLNIWGDGGVIVTRSEDLAQRLRLLRNHGLSSRDEVLIFGRNSRLDSVQAVIANRLIPEVHGITEQRIANAKRYDEAFSGLGEFLTIPPRRNNVKQVFHTYVIQVQARDALLAYLLENGITAKIHYPIPVHLQPAALHLGYKAGNFPLCERHCQTILSLPVHQHLTEEELDYVIEHVRTFYSR